MAVAATFTAEPLLQPLELVLSELGLRPRLQLAPYQSLLQLLLSPASLLATHAGVANVVLVRVEDFVREVLDPADALRLIERVSRELPAALLQCARRSHAALLVLLLPGSALRPEPLGEALEATTARLRGQLSGCRALQLIDVTQMDACRDGKHHDRLRDALAHIPFDDEYFAAIALVLATRIHALCVPGQAVPAQQVLRARRLASGTAVLEALRQRQRRRRPLRERAVQPASVTERELLTLWQELLNIEELGVEDNYFALGGSSQLAARLCARMAHRFGVRLRPERLTSAPTVRLLARALQSEQAARATLATSLLVELRAGGPMNLFLVHDADGGTLCYRSLAQQLPAALSVYGIEPPRLPGVPLAASSLPQLAADYVTQMRRLQPTGPYRLGGRQAGGVIAFEMARQLVAAGEAVAMVALLQATRSGSAARAGSIAHLGPQRLWTQLRLALLRRRLARGRPWPARLPSLSVREIYDSAEARYVPDVLAGAGVVLLRTPGADEALEWRSLVPDLQIVDIAGAPAGLLQEPQVVALAAALAERLLPSMAHESDRATAGSGAR